MGQFRSALHPKEGPTRRITLYGDDNNDEHRRAFHVFQNGDIDDYDYPGVALKSFDEMTEAEKKAAIAQYDLAEQQRAAEEGTVEAEASRKQAEKTTKNQS